MARRYIDADALEHSLDRQLKHIEECIQSDMVKITCELLVSALHLEIKNAHIADVAEVVRCKDCVYWETETEPIGIECEPGENAHYCAMDGLITRTADYCSSGHRK